MDVDCQPAGAGSRSCAADVTCADPLALFGLHGQAAFVTGASSGLGSRFAPVSTRPGAYLHLHNARAADQLELVADQVLPALTQPRVERKSRQ